MLHRSADGEYTLVLPQDADEKRLDAGRRYLLPRGEEETIRVTEPPGSEAFILIGSEEPVNLARLIPRGAEALRGRVVVSIARFEVRR